MTLKLGIVGGGGWLGGAIAHACLRAGLVKPADLALSYRSAAPCGIPEAFVSKDSQEVADRSDVILIAVRPEDWSALTFTAKGKLVISVMAGIGLAALAERHRSPRIVRALPNAAAEFGASYTPFACAEGLGEQDRAVVHQIFACCGSVDEVAGEDQVDYLSGLTGTGPAYPALMALAMERDAVARGLDPAVAQRAVIGLLIGTGRILEANPQSPEAIVETFMAYRGLTAAGLAAMEAAGLEAAVHAGLAAALAKGKAMGG